MTKLKDNYTMYPKSAKLTMHLLKLIGLCYPSGQKTIANLKLVVVTTSMTLSTCILSHELYRAKNDLKTLLMISPTSIVVIVEFFKLLVFIFNRKKIREMQEFTQSHFWQVEYNKNERKMLRQYDRFSLRCVFIYCIFCGIIGGQYVLSSPFNSNKENSNNLQRILPFPIYVDFIMKTPYYQIVFVLQMIELIVASACIFTFTTFYITSNTFSAVQFKILSNHLEAVCDFTESKVEKENLQLQKNSCEKLKELVRKHQLLIDYISKMEDIYCCSMLVHIFGVTTQIVFSAFQIALQDPRQHIAFSAEFLVSNFINLYFHCYFADQVFKASECISKSAYFAKWFKITHADLYKDLTFFLQIIIHRARKPCVLTVGKFSPLNLVTFTWVAKTSLSGFTILRQITFTDN